MKLIVGRKMGLTTDIFIDTQVFVTNNFDLTRTAFKELVRRVEEGYVRIFLTSVTVGEVRKQIKEKVARASSKIDELRRDLRILANSRNLEVAARSRRLNVKEVEQELIDQFDDFIEEIQAEILGLESVNSVAVFDKYFAVEAPFELRQEKRKEFPDAFVVEILKTFVKSRDCDLIAVSNDKGFAAACGKASIAVVKTVEEFLDLETKKRESKVSEHVLEGYHALFSGIESEIKNDFKNSGFFLTDVDGDVASVSLDELEVGEPLIVSLDEHRATLEVLVSIRYHAQISYDDPDATVYDKEDDRILVFNTIEGTVEEEADFPLEITVDFDPADPMLFDFSLGSLNDGNDFEVHPR